MFYFKNQCASGSLRCSRPTYRLDHWYKRVLNRFHGIRDFPYLRLGIRDYKANSGQASGLKVCLCGGMPKIKMGLRDCTKILGRDYGIEEPYWGPSYNIQAVKSVYDASLLLVGTLMSVTSAGVSLFGPSVVCAVLTKEICKLLAFLWLIPVRHYHFIFFSVSGW